jgi:hypothetical protein
VSRSVSAGVIIIISIAQQSGELGRRHYSTALQQFRLHAAAYRRVSSKRKARFPICSVLHDTRGSRLISVCDCQTTRGLVVPEARSCARLLDHHTPMPSAVRLCHGVVGRPLAGRRCDADGTAPLGTMLSSCCLSGCCRSSAAACWEVSVDQLLGNHVSAQRLQPSI